LPFGAINLEVKFKELYSAWEGSLIEEISDFKNQKGEKVKAVNEYYITEAP